ncbi:Sec-independent protein translocase protein TatB [Basilea psittacipulmonis]|uniref:Sec-independent protein translocase protein TatB n=1 Tax=Basilea psittacipulmonis TaxID=1472345 RepID=UPI00068F4C98|nr:Sec-independent protein translocase protein TatB [Basilea psittacipulmonis]
MFGFSFGELFIIALVALVVLGPERLPKVARSAGLLFGRFQRYMNDLKSDLQSEINIDEVKDLKKTIEQGVANPFESAVNDLRSSADKLKQDLTSGLGELKNEVEQMTHQPQQENPTHTDSDSSVAKVEQTDKPLPKETSLVASQEMKKTSSDASESKTETQEKVG